jgi:micrococcal nuclease
MTKKKQRILVRNLAVGLILLLGAGGLTSAQVREAILTLFALDDATTPLPLLTVIEPTPEPIIRESSASAALDCEPAVVKRVVDGDTIVLEDERRVRYLGIDTPETVDPRRPVGCYGQEASVRNKELVEGQTVCLEKDVSDTDKYDRLLRYVYLDSVMINELLVREGFAQVATYPPDVKYQAQLQAAAETARIQGLGLWGEACTSLP